MWVVMKMRCLVVLSVAAVLATAADRAGGTALPRTRASHSIGSTKPALKPQKPKVASRDRDRRFGPAHALKQPRVKSGHAAASFEDRTFAVIDSNRDGTIAFDEVEAAKSRLSEELLSGQQDRFSKDVKTVRKRLSTALTDFDVMRLDQDGDGLLTKQEWRRLTSSWRELSATGWKDSAFKFMDVDGDGRATRSERGSALKSLRDLRQTAEQADEDLRDGYRRLLAFLEKSDGEFNVRSFDENKDGVLTLNEFLAGPKIASRPLPGEQGRAQQGNFQPAASVGNDQAPESMPKKPASPDRKEQPSRDWRKRSFAFLDRNADSVVDTHEIHEAHAELRRDKSAGVRLPMEKLWLLRIFDLDGSWRTRADQNGDSRITLDELMAYDSSGPAVQDARDVKRASSFEL